MQRSYLLCSALFLINLVAMQAAAAGESCCLPPDFQTVKSSMVSQDAQVVKAFSRLAVSNSSGLIAINNTFWSNWRTKKTKVDLIVDIGTV